MSGNVWNPDQTRVYPDGKVNKGTERLRNQNLSGKKKIDYSSIRGWHPDDVVNQQYIDAGAARDVERPLCFAVHNGVACRRPIRIGRNFCYVGNTG